MSKTKSFFLCNKCGHRESKWLGKCPECGEWNSFTESLPEGPGLKMILSSEALPLSRVKADAGVRIDTGMEEMNRILGGGLMKGSSVLVGGEPGIGKSTLMMQVASLSVTSGKILYVSGEESPGQLKARAKRLSLSRENLQILCETRLSVIEKILEKIKPEILIIDSVQTLFSSEAGQVPGTVNQIKYCSYEIVSWARSMGAAVLLTAHVTKEGVIAGPKVIEHLVDTVLHFEQANSEVRILRISKNRHGSADEIGLFYMDEKGLKEVKNPSSYFMVKRKGDIPSGISVAPVYEGSRILLVELQALVVPAKNGFSRIYSDRVDPGRVSRIAAVLEKHISLRFSDQDIYVNVAGGIRLKEVGIELPLALALYSARTDLPLPGNMALAGELSLAGEIRPVSHLKRRIKTASEMGFTRFIGPEGIKEDGKYESVSTIKGGISAVFPAGKR